MAILLSLATLVAGIAVGLALTVFVVRPFQAARRAEQLARYQRDFRRQREQLEAKFIDQAAASGKPRGLRWSDVSFEDEVFYARDRRTIGIGAGQMSRVYSARIAGIKAADEGLEVAGAVMASDAFFPFRDGIDSAAEAGIRAVIQPGGSMRDEEVIAAADEAGIAMVFTGMRHFRH